MSAFLLSLPLGVVALLALYRAFSRLYFLGVGMAGTPVVDAAEQQDDYSLTAFHPWVEGTA